MIGNLIYEKDKDRIAGYQAKIDDLLANEEKILSQLSHIEADRMGLEMLLIKIKTHEAAANTLSEKIKKDASELSGDYLAATGIYQTTADDIALRYKKLREMASEALVSVDSADALKDGTDRINRLREFAKSLKNN